MSLQTKGTSDTANERARPLEQGLECVCVERLWNLLLLRPQMVRSSGFGMGASLRSRPVSGPESGPPLPPPPPQVSRRANLPPEEYPPRMSGPLIKRWEPVIIQTHLHPNYYLFCGVFDAQNA